MKKLIAGVMLMSVFSVSHAGLFSNAVKVGSLVSAGIVAKKVYDEIKVETGVAGVEKDITYNELSGKVIGVTDGDTITILSGGNKYEVRLANIDAPETSCHIKIVSNEDENCVESKQEFGKESKMFLKREVYGNTVTVKYNKKDKYQRIIGTVYLNDNDINYFMLKNGYAWFYKSFAMKEMKRESFYEYEQAEKSAVDSRIGIWVNIDDKKPTPPWKYRN